MRVGIVTKYLRRPVGLGTYATNLLEALAAVAPGVELTVYAPEPPPGSRVELAAWELIRTPLAARRAGLDLVHYLYAGGPLLAGRPPMLITLADAAEWTLRGYGRPVGERLLLRRQIRSAAGVITFSAAAKAELQRAAGVPEEKISVTPLAGPVPEPQREERQPFWLFVGGTERRKNLRLVLAALAYGAPADMRVKVVGAESGGPRFENRTELEAAVPAAARERIDWLGTLDGRPLARLYGEATALVYPSFAEGFGLPVLEAMARGTPVIAADIPAISEVAGDAALLVDPHDPAGLAEAMRRLASDTRLRAALAERGLAALGRHSWKETARQTVAAYRRVLASSS